MRQVTDGQLAKIEYQLRQLQADLELAQQSLGSGDFVCEVSARVRADLARRAGTVEAENSNLRDWLRVLASSALPDGWDET